MRKWIVAVSIVALGSGACNTQNAATENDFTPGNPALTITDVIPVNYPHTARTKADRNKIVADDLKRFRSRKLAGAYYISQAQRAYNEQKTDSAGLLFGKAWQMDSSNIEVYYGLAKLYGEQEAYDKALFILHYALQKDRNNPQLLKAMATSHLGRYYEEHNPQDLQKSRKLLEKAIKLKPNEADAYYKLSITHYYLSAYSKAWKYLHQSVNHDKSIADKTFITALLEKQQDPKGVYRH